MSRIRLALALGLGLALLPHGSAPPVEAQSPSANLQILMTTGANMYKSPALVLYTIAVTNAGPDSATDVVVTDDLPLRPKDDMILLPVGCSLPDAGTVLTCSLGSIAFNETKLVRVSVRFRGARGLVRNTATVSSLTSDPDHDNNASTNQIIVGQNPKQ